MDMMVVKVLCLCAAVAAAETLHGIARTLFVAPRIGHRLAKQLSVVTGSLLAFGVSFVMVPWTGIAGTGPLLLLGAALSLFMLLFDIVMGRAVFKMPWDAVFADLDIRRGGYLPFGLIALAASPLLVMHIRAAGR